MYRYVKKKKRENINRIERDVSVQNIAEICFSTTNDRSFSIVLVIVQQNITTLQFVSMKKRKESIVSDAGSSRSYRCHLQVSR